MRSSLRSKSRESLRRRRRRSKPIKDQLVSNSFGLAVVALSRGIKPADWLAARIRAAGGRCSVRHADRLISGARKVKDARVLLALIPALLD
jgi:hypothetical protein